MLAFLQALEALGATTALTIANPPYIGGDAADWWREVAKVAILLRQVYFTSPNAKGLYALGPARASRSMRQGMRGARRAPDADRDPGGPGRARAAVPVRARAWEAAPGLQPTSAWLEIVKLEALAAKQVASEFRIQGIWSWGWATFSVAGNDPDKPAAACVWLWARDPRLCDGPALAGPSFDASLTEGQLALPAGVRCTLGTGRILKSNVGRTAALTGDRESAASALLERAVLRAEEPIDPQTVLAAERAIVRDRFGRSAARYRAALNVAGLTLGDARAIIADRLARDRVEERFRPRPAASAQIAEFLATYAATRVRLVSVEPEAPWLGDAFRGYAVETIAPIQVFALPQARRSLIDTVDGRFAVRPLGPPVPLLGLPPTAARGVARAVLGRFARADVYERWLSSRQGELLATAVCARDALPVKGDVDLTLWAPFLGD